MALGFTSVTPTSGLTGGRRLIKILGTDFDVNTATDPISMKVLFGTKPAKTVEVRSTAILTCINPENEPGAVDITLENLVNPATVVAAGVFTYGRPDLKVNSGLTFICRTLIQKLKRQIIPEVVLSTDTDFDASTGDGLNITELAKLPAIQLSGPRMPENRFYSENGTRFVDLGGGVFEEQRLPHVVDLEFDYMIVDNHLQRAMNLMQQVSEFFEKNKFLEVEKVPGDPSKGEVEYEMDLLTAGDPNLAPVGSNSNIQAARGSFVIKGVPLESVEPLGIRETADINGEVVLEPTEVL